MIKTQREWKTHFDVFILKFKGRLRPNGYDCASTARGPGPITGGGTKTPQAMQGGQKKKKNLRLTTNKIQMKCKTSNRSGVYSNPTAHCL